MSEDAKDMGIRLFRMFTKTGIVRVNYQTFCSQSEKIPYSVNDYKDVIASVSGYKIKVLTVPEWAPVCFKGQLLKSEEVKEATILVPPIKNGNSHGLTECERRFSVIKEACHLLIDSKTDSVDRISSLVTSIVTGNNARIVLDHQPKSIKSEYIGELAAQELLLPSSYRKEYEDKMKSGEMSPLDVAQKFMIPEQQVNKMFNEELRENLEEYREVWLDAMDEIGPISEVPLFKK